MEPIQLHGSVIFVAHVKTGYEERREHISKMLCNSQFEWMLDGDIADISPERDARYFRADAHLTPSQKSCALKHVLICREIVDRNLPGALVLEDDICLHDRFPVVFARSLAEIEQIDRPLIANYEDTRLRFVPRSRREKGRVLYPGDRDRMTGCYYINRAGAEAVLREVDENKIGLPADHFHKKLLNDGKLLYLWAQPTVATQGSHNGLFRSAINSNKTSWTERKWLLLRAYKKLIYNLR